MKTRRFFQIGSKLFFLAPDDGGNLSGGSSAAPDAPAITDEPILSTAEFEQQLAGALNEDSKAAPIEPVKPPEKPVDKKPDADPKKPVEPAKPDPKKSKEDSMADLRKAREAAEARVKELETERESFKTTSQKSLESEKATLQAQIDQLKAERDSIVSERDDIRKSLHAIDANQAPEVKELQNKFNAEIAQTFEQIPSLSVAAYNDLLRGFMSLPHGKEDFPEKRAAFREELKEAFPDDWKEVEGAVLRGVRHVRDERALISNIQKDSTGFQHKRNIDGWTEKGKRFDESSKSYFAADDAKREADPYNPWNFLADLSKADPESGKKIEAEQKKITDFVRSVWLGPKPVTDADFEGMQPHEIAQRVDEMQERHQKNGQMMMEAAAHGLLLRRIFPTVIQLFKKSQEALEAAKKSDPPDPTAAAKAGDATQDDQTIPSGSAVANEIMNAVGKAA